MMGGGSERIETDEHLSCQPLGAGLGCSVETKQPSSRRAPLQMSSDELKVLFMLDGSKTLPRNASALLAVLE
jgi:hypothetical protein